MKKQQHSPFVEHNLVPGTLFILNICFAHVIYAFSSGSLYPTLSKAALVTALLFLVVSLVPKRQFLLIGAISFYLIMTLTISLAL